MENTCVLTILPVIPNWKIYNSVPKKPVKYCTILTEKREFQNLLENAFSKNLKNSCSIIDKKIFSSEDKNSLEIVFLNQEEKDLLSLNLTVSKKQALRRRNNLLIFLKNNANNLKYHIQDRNIYVKCNASIQWHVFYNLFEFLLVKYGICNIGAMFYCVFFSGSVLKQEIRFICCNPTDVDSTSYSFLLNLHESVTNVGEKNLSHTCKKLPKRALCYQNYFNESFVSTDSQELTFKILSGSVPNKNTMEKDSISNCIMPRRKIPRLDCVCSKIHCKCHESKWTLHKNISKYNVNCYMDILLKKGVTSTDELSVAQGEASFSSTFGNFSSHDFDFPLSNTIGNSVPPIELLKRSDLPLSEFQNGEKYSQNPGDQCGSSTRDTVPVITKNTTGNKLEPKPESLARDTVSVLTKSTAGNKLEPKPESLLKAINLLNKDVGEKENFSFALEEFSEKKGCTSTTAAFNMFQTASGKKVNISDTALKAAEKIFTEVMQSEDDFASGDKSANVPTGSKLRTKRDASYPINESTNHTETGSYKHLNESIDEMLVDSFFEDVCFDEKDEGLPDATQSSMCTNKRVSSVGKVRKSLGGRRSLKPYAIPKS